MRDDADQPLERQDAHVLLSGGLDSTVMLYFVTTLQHERIFCWAVDYGQRHSIELEYAGHHAKYATGAPLRMLHIPKGLQPASMLTDETAQVPNMDYAEMSGRSPTFVPFRNGLMLALVAAQAEAIALAHPDPNRAAMIYMGMHAGDAEGGAYPDCTPEFAFAMMRAIRLSSENRVSFRAPFLNTSKARIVEIGRDLEVPMEATWSCYKGGSDHCGTCPTCRARQRAFADAGVPDGTIYSTRTEASNAANAKD